MSRTSVEYIFKIIKDLLAKEGDDKFTMDRLAEESGLSRSTLYRRFGGRQALLQRLAKEQGVEVAELDAPDIRTRILEAARSLFGRVGLVAATVEEVAQEAGVGQATVYRQPYKYVSSRNYIRWYKNGSKSAKSIEMGNVRYQTSSDFGEIAFDFFIDTTFYVILCRRQFTCKRNDVAWRRSNAYRRND